MERRTASQTEEEEMNQRRRLLNQARRGDPKAINRLFELYQVRVYTGEAWKKGGGSSAFSRGAYPKAHQKTKKQAAKKKPLRKRAVRKPVRPARPARRAKAKKSSRKVSHHR